MDKTNWHKFSQFGLLCLMILILAGGWSYIQTEVLSFGTNIDGVKICQTENLKYFKITSFDGKSGQAQILCIRNDLAQSSFHKLNLVKTNFNRDQNWEIIFTQKIYTDGNLFWPIYL
jgi:hypothetical protein